MMRSAVASAIYGCLGSLLLSVGIASPVRAQSSGSTQSKAPEYVGSETCKTCHEEVYKNWEKGPHWKQTLKEGGIAKHGCEDCHGAGAAHVADPADTSTLFLFEKASSKDINARCLTCHVGGPQHMNTINSEHAKNDVSCTSCHSSHHPETNEFLLK
jgi:Cytochrome c554 and c-prime